MLRQTIDNPVGQRGFSLVEIMVGALLGLIGTIVIFQVFSVSEEQKRATTGTGEAVQAASTALFQIQRDAMSAGFGLSKFIYGCPVNGWYDNGTPGGQDLDFSIIPASIVRSPTATGSDTISFASGTSELAALPTGLLAPQASETMIRVLNRYGFKPGDLIILQNFEEPDAATNYARFCSMFQVSALPTGAGFDDQILLFPGMYVTPDLQNRKIEYNRPGGLVGLKQKMHRAWVPGSSATNQGRGGLVVNLGTMPRFTTYSIDNYQLVMGSPLTGTGTIPIGDQIVKMKAHFGIDGNLPNPDGRLDGSMDPEALGQANLTLGQDHWAETLAPATILAPPILAPGIRSYLDWRRVIAIRVVLVSRGEKLRPNSSGVCDASTEFPKWRAADNLPLDVSADPDWRCYKYTTQEMTIPLRNLMWSTADLGVQPTNSP